MVKTQVADIIVPSIFEKYAIERTAELANFGQCGIVKGDPFFDQLASGGGQTVQMPFWQDLSATRQLLSDSATLSSNKMTASQDVARIQNDAQVWSVNDLAHLLSGDDPMKNWWGRIFSLNIGASRLTDGTDGTDNASYFVRANSPSPTDYCLPSIAIGLR